MTPSDPVHGAQAAYDFWLGLIPQFLGQFGGAIPRAGTDADTKPDAGTAAPLSAAMFPVDQIAKAAATTQASLQAMAESIAPVIRSVGATGLLGQWATATPAFAFGKADEAAASTATAAQAWASPWNAFTGATPAQLTTAFDRTYGALSDALGLSPLRKLQVAWQDLVAASIAQQEARTRYALLVQGAFAQGLQRLMADLAGRAGSGERIDSVLALLRLWATKTEEVVHETLQSEAGLAATAALTRSALTCRKKTQHVASIIADVLDMATRRELDEAYREIQALKRELRASRSMHARGKRGSKMPDRAAR